MNNLEEIITSSSVTVLILATVLLLVLAGVSLKLKKLTNLTKKVLYIAICLSVLVPTLYLAIATIYLNNVSSSKGPVHWHADIEIWACGKELDLKDPTGWSNKIGTPTLHEHNDKRIHLEGVVLTPADASLGKFFRVIGGGISPTALTVPTTTGDIAVSNGMTCLTDGRTSDVQVFVYQTDKDNYFSQKKVADPASYIMSPQSAVPAGDCIIVEFDSPKERTDKLCRSYRVAEQIGKLKGEKTNEY